ncbi:MAG: P1 family peptidase [Thermomicrobiales bacterium]
MTAHPAARPRARDLGIVLGVLPPGPHNAITDVEGVRVGHTTLWRGDGPLVRGVGPVRTGVTAILPHGDNLFLEKVPAAAAVFNGFGKTTGLVQVDELGELETPILLTNTLSVGQVSDALVGWMVEQHPAIGVTTSSVNPVVAECNDGYLNDLGGRHVGEADVRAAIAEARGGPVAEGNLGGGTGMVCYGWAGGIGTASRRLAADRGGWTVGALVLANFGRPQDLLIAGVPVGRELAKQAAQEREHGSIIVVIATDAPVDARQLGRIARRGPLGLALTGSHGGHGSGDVVIAFSTANRIPHYATALVRQATLVDEHGPAIDGLFAATVEATEEAVINALCAARTIVGRDDHRREALPTAEVVEILRQRGAME